MISKLAAQGNPGYYTSRAMMHSGDYSFSLSGLKTAVITYIEWARIAQVEQSIDLSGARKRNPRLAVPSCHGI